MCVREGEEGRRAQGEGDAVCRSAQCKHPAPHQPTRQLLRSQQPHALAAQHTCSPALNLSRVPATALPTGEVSAYATSKSHSLRAHTHTLQPANQGHVSVSHTHVSKTQMHASHTNGSSLHNKVLPSLLLARSTVLHTRNTTNVTLSLSLTPCLTLPHTFTLSHSLTHLKAATCAATITSGGCSGLIASNGSKLSGSPTTLDNTHASFLGCLL